MYNIHECTCTFNIRIITMCMVITILIHECTCTCTYFSMHIHVHVDEYMYMYMCNSFRCQLMIITISNEKRLYFSPIQHFHGGGGSYIFES